MTRAAKICPPVGIALAVILVSPPIDSVADGSLSAHMLQHMLLLNLAAPLIACAAPVRLLLRRLDRDRRRSLIALVHSRPARLAAGAPLAFAAYAGFQWALHLTGLFALSLRDEPVHAAVHLGILATGVLFWRQVVGGDPGSRLRPLPRIGFLLAAMPAMDAIGVWLLSAPAPEYAHYSHGAGALADQRLAGVIMLAGSYVFALAALGTILHWLNREQRRTRLGERLRERAA